MRRIIVLLTIVIFGSFSHSSAQNTIAVILSNPSCPRACFLGIVPGTTTRSELEQILQSSSLQFTVAPLGLDVATTTAFAYYFNPAIFSPQIQDRPQSVTVLVANNLVEEVAIAVQNFSISEIINVFGHPSASGVSINNSIVVYRDVGIRISFDLIGATTRIILYSPARQIVADEFTNLQPCSHPSCQISTATPTSASSTSTPIAPTATPLPTLTQLPSLTPTPAAPTLTTRIETEANNGTSAGITVAGTYDAQGGGQEMRDFAPGGWLRFDNVNLRGGVVRLRLRADSPHNGTLSLRVGGAGGSAVCTLIWAGSSSYNTQQATCSSAVSGIQTLYLTNDSVQWLNANWFMIERAG